MKHMYVHMYVHRYVHLRQHGIFVDCIPHFKNIIRSYLSKIYTYIWFKWPFEHFLVIENVYFKQNNIFSM
jgi:hypothetical protein